MTDTLPPERASYAALSQAVNGIADGFDQQRPWFRPDPVVMSTLRRAAAALERAEADQAAALATERERCAKVCDARAAAHLRDYTDAASPLYQSAEADHAADEAAACADAIRAKAAT
jgi:hypothetical protein